MIRRLWWLTLGLALAAAPAWAAFEDVEVSPRLRAVGGAGVASDDAFAPLGNPAALAWADALTGTVSYVQPFSLGFATQNAFAAGAPLPGRAGGVGVGVRAFGVRWQGASLDRELTATLAHGFHLLADRQSELAVGWSLSLYSLSFGTSITGLDPGGASAVGLGLGAIAVVRDRTRVGFAVTNLNDPSIGDRDREPLARRVTGGIAYTAYPGVTTYADIHSTLGEAVQYRGGLELETTDFLWLRAGVRTEPNTFSFGVGVRARALRVDYGYSSGGGVLADTHQIGLTIAGPAPWSGGR